MLRKALIGKIHRARVTGADLNYEGSIEIDETLLKLSGMAPYEYVEIYNITTGGRFSTYIIVGPADSGNIILNGAAARLVQINDEVIITAYGYIDQEALCRHQPRVVLVDAANRPIPIED